VLQCLRFIHWWADTCTRGGDLSVRLGFGFRFSGFGFRISVFGFRVLGLGFRVLVLGFRVSGFGFRFPIFSFRASGFGIRVRLWVHLGAGTLVDLGETRGHVEREVDDNPVRAALEYRSS